MRYVAITEKTLVLAVVLGLTLPGCSKKKETAQVAPQAAAKEGRGKKVDEGAAKADKVVVPTADKADGSPVAKSKVMIDKLEQYLKIMLTEIEAAKGDKALLKDIAIKFQKFAETQRGEGEALHKSMTPEQQAEVGKYGNSRVKPLMNKIMPPLSHGVAAALAANRVLAAAMAPPGTRKTPTKAPKTVKTCCCETRDKAVIRHEWIDLSVCTNLGDKETLAGVLNDEEYNDFFKKPGQCVDASGCATDKCCCFSIGDGEHFDRLAPQECESDMGGTCVPMVTGCGEG